MDKTVEKRIKEWLSDPYNEETRKEIKELIKKNPQKLEEAFSEKLKFGTGGIRALMGVGPARLNIYTIRRVTQGLANYILQFPESKWKSGVAICHDCRNHAREFAEEAARVLAGNKIPVYLVKDLRPTPFASFAVRHYGAIAGINITASHNPKDYNGYKVYWEDGAQVVPPHDKKIINEVESIEDIKNIPLADNKSPLIHIIDEKVEKAYLDEVYKISVFPKEDRKDGGSLKISYTPLHGAGITMIPEALKQWGFTNVEPVREQEKPDGNFPTANYPNPETIEALKLGLRDLKEKKSDLLLASDPDADRLSCSLLYEGKERRLSGNELGSLMLHFLLDNKKPKGRFATVTTIVSSPLIKRMTKDYGGTCFEVLTGFKYIGEKIHQWETSKKDKFDFLFGMEESLGYLAGTYVRDKDATVAACLTAEMALHAKKAGKTLIDQLYEIYRKYGVYREGQRVLEITEQEKMLKMMSDLRNNLPKQFFGTKILEIEDYQTGEATNMESGEKRKLDLPKSNVLVFKMQNNSQIIARPSGTEPKLKLYGQVMEQSKGSVAEKVKSLEKKLVDMLEEFEKTFFKEG